ncbi:MAG: isoprenylcysteine carboxylmethyltransferase family protein [Sandaracinus sp.]|nr:isoprenylcysteine carboxylmethyltransferase family protein [Sandaracinus sp.]MCB9636588.1 isoprenylcysteine carboxylmethyltransferase family protein [Sandaracinus sp.]
MDWTSAPVIVTCLALLVPTVVDVFLRHRYAAGGGERDEGTARRLIVSLNLNTLVLFALPSFGIASFEEPRALMSLGAVLCVLGVVVRYVAIFRLGRLFTWRVAILDGHALQTAGLFRWIRHPSYAGGIVAMIGAALAFGSWGALLCFVATHVPVLLQRIRVEERVLASTFGEAWERYAAHTSRLVPFVW